MRKKIDDLLDAKPFSNHDCAAGGCVFPGSLSHAAGDNSSYYCRYHYGKGADMNGKITRYTEKLKPLHDALHALHDESGWGRVTKALQEAQRPDLMPSRAVNKAGKEVDERVSIGFYKYRVFQTLAREVSEFAEKRVEEVPIPKPKGGWIDFSNIAGEY